MAREVFVYRAGKGVISREEAYQHDFEKGAGPNVIRDTIDPLYCPLDNQFHTSKASIRRVARAMGMEEVGTEKMKDTRQALRPTTRDDFERSIQMLNQGYRPTERYESEL
jgi:hypothetical protein